MSDGTSPESIQHYLISETELKQLHEAAGNSEEIASMVEGIKQYRIFRGTKLSNSFGRAIIHRDYLGDGVYALGDGYGIWLHSNDLCRPDDRIYLEPSVLAALNDFKKYCDAKEPE